MPLNSLLEKAARYCDSRVKIERGGSRRTCSHLHCIPISSAPDILAAKSSLLVARHSGDRSRALTALHHLIATVSSWFRNHPEAIPLPESPFEDLEVAPSVEEDPGDGHGACHEAEEAREGAALLQVRQAGTQA